ncbi:MAG: ATP synthase F0 subunit B [bacterium]|nr:ATP synthase F0 subunit B [bacterium]
MIVENNLETIETHGSAESQSVTASLGLNTQLFVFQLINFAIVGAIVWFLILKPLTRKMAERKKQIDDSIDNAKRVETNLAQSEKQYQLKIDEAKVAANKIAEGAHEEGEKIAKMLKEKSRHDIELLVTQAKKNLEIDKAEMKDEIRKETAQLISLALEKILSEKFDSKKDEKFIEDILKKIS